MYNQRGTESILLKRTITRSIAGTTAGIYIQYLNSTQLFKDFNKSVSNFLVYVGKRENVSCSAYLRLIFKNGTYFDYRLLKGREGKTSIRENITVSLGDISGLLHVYALVNRSFISTYKSTPVGVYIVAYYDSGVPPSSLTVSSVNISDGESSSQCIEERPFVGGRAIYSCYAPSTSIGKSIMLTIRVNIGEVDGKPYPPLIFQVPGKPYTYTKSVMINDTETDPLGVKYRYVDYYLGEKVNLTESASWSLTNRKGMVCKGYGAGIPTGSNYPCADAENLPLPVFLVQGPINITLNYDSSDDRVISRQIIFIEPYFSQISVTVAKG